MYCLIIVAIIFLCELKVQCCKNETFTGTRITAVKNVSINREITEYNFFNKRGETIPINHVTGCISSSTVALEEVVAIQIRGENVPVFYEYSVYNLPFLHSLHVDSCRVNALRPHAFANLPSISVIKFQDNDIINIPSDVFSNLGIQKLSLSFNNITYISPTAFDNMPRLESIDLNFNKIMSIGTEWFNNCPKVEYLSMKFNLLEEIPARAFKNVRGSLTRLYLSNNNLQHLDRKAFEGLMELTDLTLSGNNISSLDDGTFLYLPNLQMIDLSKTSLHCLSDFLLRTLRSDVLIWIDDIPLNSTCVTSLKEWAVDNKNTLTFYKTLRNDTNDKGH